MEDKGYQEIVIKVSIITVILNLLLSISKLLVGYISKSNAIISDGVHSASDVLSTAIVMIGVTLANKKPDKEHPYGHERVESIASLLLAVILIIVGIMIGIQGGYEIFYPVRIQQDISKQQALWVAIISIIIKEGMYWYTRKYAKQIHSDALMADAWHHRSDALSSIGSSIGVIGYMLGYPVCDSIASIIICLCIIKVGTDIGKDAINKLIDHSCEEEKVNKIKKIVLAKLEVQQITEIRTRLFGNKIYVEIQLMLPSNISVQEAWNIIEKIKKELKEQIKEMKKCTIEVVTNEIENKEFN